MPESTSIPEVVDYTVNGEGWRCLKFTVLLAEFEDIQPAAADLERFHQVASQRPSLWVIVRRLCGLQPVVPGMKADEADLQTWHREDLRVSLGLKNAELKAALDAVRGAWKAAVRGQRSEFSGQGSAGSGQRSEISGRATNNPPLTTDTNTTDIPELALLDDAELRSYGINVKLSSEEVGWMRQQLKVYERALKEPVVAGFARNALVLELQMQRLQRHVTDESKCPIGSRDYNTNNKLLQDMDASYRVLIDTIQEKCPWMDIAGGYAFHGQLADVTRAYQEAKRDGRYHLTDGVFNATGGQVELMRSVQAPEPQYRMGLVVYLNMCRQHLFDPGFNPAQYCSHLQLKKLDAMGKAAAMAVGELENERLPDLEKDGPEGEYDDLVTGE